MKTMIAALFSYLHVMFLGRQQTMAQGLGFSTPYIGELDGVQVLRCSLSYLSALAGIWERRETAEGRARSVSLCIYVRHSAFQINECLKILLIKPNSFY